MPPGPQDITCWVNGEPRRLQFTVTARHAELLDAKLQKMLAKAKAGTGDKPLTDYNHDDNAASGRPQRLVWGGDDPKTGGIRLKNKWTGKAKGSIRDEEYDRFSPQWDFDENTGEIVGIGVNLGGLVNKAAFQQIATVRARDASGAELGGQSSEVGDQSPDKTILAAGAASNANKPPGETGTTKENDMTETEIATAVAKGVEAATISLGKTIKELSDKLGQIETSTTAQAKNAATASAKSAVARHVQRGAIAPQDTKAIAFWEASHAANAVDAEEQLAKLAAPSRGRVIQSGTETSTAAGDDPDAKIIAAGAALHAKNSTAIASDAAGLEAYLKTPAGNAAYAESLRARSPRRHDVASAR